MADETMQLAEYITSTSKHALTDTRAVEMAREAVWDWIGCTVAGACDARVQPLYQMERRLPMPGLAAVVGRRQTAHPLIAALLNGAASHVIELDDIERTAYFHPGVAPISAALAAFAVNPGCTERNFLRAVTVGYEVGIRVGRAVNPSHYRYWHTTGTAGAFGAAAATAVVLGLNVPETAWALGNAGTEAAGLWQFNRDGAMTKPYHAGMAAYHGLVAALAAQNGLTGAHRILEGEQGFMKAMSQGPNPAAVTDGLGEARPAILGISRKRFAACRFTHGPIDAVLELRQEGPAGEVERVIVETFETAIRVAGHSDPQTPQEAKFSIAYCSTLAWLTGSVSLDGFNAQERRSGEEFADLFARVEVRENARYNQMLPDSMPCRVTVFWKNGTRSEREVLRPVGDPECPIQGSDLSAKVRELLHWAGWSEELRLQGEELVRRLGSAEGNENLVRLVEIL